MKTKGKIVGILICIVILLSMAVSSTAQETQKGTYYQIDNTSKIISRVEPKTEISTFIKELNISSSNIKVYKDKTKAQEVTSGYIATGMVLECESLSDDYEISVIGDIDSDGEATQLDLSYIISDIVGIEEEKLDRVKYISADLTGDGEVDQRDITKYTRFIVFGEWDIDKIYTEIPEASTETGTISFEGPIWNEEKASINITTNTNYQIEYQVNSAAGTWIKANIAKELQNNDIVYARLTDGIHTGNYTSITIVDTKKPEIELNLASATSSITAQVVAIDNETGIANDVTYKFSIKETSGPDTSYVEAQDTTENICEITGLKQDTSYTIKVEVADIAGNVQNKIETIKTKVIPDASIEIGAITFGTTNWVNGKASIMISTTTQYQIEYQVNSIEGTWTRIANAAQSVTVKNLKHGDVIYARLFDGTNSGNYASYNIVDRQKPEITLTLTPATSSITAVVQAVDGESGLANNVTYKFSIKEASNPDASYTTVQETTSKTCTITGLKQNTSYNVKVELQDIVGNIAEKIETTITKEIPDASVQGAIIFGTTNWANGKAVVEVSTDTNLQIEYQINSLEGTWTRLAKGTNTVTINNLVHGNIIYARLFDGTNVGNYVSHNIVDGQKPFLTLTLTSTTSSITGVVNVEDNQSQIATDATYRFTIKETIGPDTSYVEKQDTTSRTCTITGLKENVEYTVKVEVQDIAGNLEEKTATIKTKAITQLSTANMITTYSPSGWTNGDVTATVTLNGISLNVGERMQVSKDGKKWFDGWSQVYSENGTFYARVTDGLNIGSTAVAQITKIDKIKPVIITASATTKSITFTAEDTLSGIIGYKITETNTVPTSFESIENTKTLIDKTVTGLKQNTTYYIWVKDEAGNVSEYKSIKTKEITQVSSSNITFKYEPSGWTNEEVLVTAVLDGINLNSDEKMQVSTDGVNWTDGTSKVFTSNGTLYVRVVDGTNIGTTATAQIKNIDKTKPIVTTASTTTKSVTFSATDEASGIIGYKVSENNTEPVSFEKIANTKTLTNQTVTDLKQNTTYYIWVKDEAGNVSINKTVKTVAITQASSANITFTYSPSTWTNGNVVATASLNGISLNAGEKMQVSADGVNWADGTSKTYSANGTLYARVTDGINVGSAATGQITKIDKTKPEVIASSVTTNSVTFTAKDEASGIIGYKVTTTNTAPTSFDGCTNTKSLTKTVGSLTQNKTYYVWVKDEAGNVSASRTIKTSAITQASSSNITFKYEPSGWTNGSVVATAVLKGINLNAGEKMQVSTDGSTWTDGTSKTFTSNGTLYVRVVDGTNIGSTATGQVTKIDKTAPNTFNISVSNIAYNGFTISGSTTDAASGVKDYTYVVENSAGTKLVEVKNQTVTSYEVKTLVEQTSYNVYMIAYDNAGNSRKSGVKTVTTGVDEKRVRIEELNAQVADLNNQINDLRNQIPIAYNNGYNQGVADADNRVNTNSASYISGYNEGKAAGKNEVSVIEIYYGCDQPYGTYNYDAEIKITDVINGGTLFYSSWSDQTSQPVVRGTFILKNKTYTVYGWGETEYGHYSPWISFKIIDSNGATIASGGVTGSSNHYNVVI